MGLSGTVNVEPLSNLRSLLILNLSNNNFVGPFPSNINKISRRLEAFDLSNNKFSGEIPGDAFNGMKLSKVYLGNNDFTGKIPKSLVSLSRLVDLQLQNNKFEGEIPDFKRKDLVAKFANNKLEGPIPSVLSDEPASFFAGNNLCGKPLGKCPPSKKKSVPEFAFHTFRPMSFMNKFICHKSRLLPLGQCL